VVNLDDLFHCLCSPTLCDLLPLHLV
jgi:hypothetical protein